MYRGSEIQQTTRTMANNQDCWWSLAESNMRKHFRQVWWAQWQVRDLCFADEIIVLTKLLFRYGSTNYGYYGGNVFGKGYYGPRQVKQGLFAAAGWNRFDFYKGPGFLGGGDPSIASMEVFHRYLVFKSLLYNIGHGNPGNYSYDIHSSWAHWQSTLISRRQVLQRCLWSRFWNFSSNPLWAGMSWRKCVLW